MRKEKLVLKKHTTSSTLQAFEANEHKAIGDEAMKQFLLKNATLKTFLDPLIHPVTQLITLTTTVSLTSGEWVALAGDFYGVPEKPISGALGEQLSPKQHQERFKAAYSSLADIQAKEAVQELKSLRKLIRQEEATVKEAIEEGKDVSELLHAKASETNTKYAATTTRHLLTRFLTRHLPLSIIGLTLYTRYLELLVNNYDHFGEDAKIAYEAGHQVALETACEAQKAMVANDQKKAKHLLVKAITQELFACHFLTDLFASGHMRVPRRALGERAGPQLGGLLAMVMHNEDGDRGLTVQSQANATRKQPNWTAKGDGCLYDNYTTENRQKVVTAVEAALQSIYDYYCHPKQSPTFSFKEFIPEPSKKDNVMPLFQVIERERNNTLVMRKDQALQRTTPKWDQQTSKDWQADWGPKSTFLSFWVSIQLFFFDNKLRPKTFCCFH